MLDIQKRIDVISNLVAQDTIESLTYAALECRFGIEYICYDRLRIAFDYVSYTELKGWQVSKVIRAVESLANQEATQQLTVLISEDIPKTTNGNAPTQADFEKLDFKEVGTQSALNMQKLTSLWQGLASRALHVHIPKQKSDPLSIYGDKDKIKRKVEECLVEFLDIAKGTILVTGRGNETSFNCLACNCLIKRKIDLLENGQMIFCINPDCNEEYIIEKSGNDIYFTRASIDVECKSCSESFQVLRKDLRKIGIDHAQRFLCNVCQTPHIIMADLKYAIEKPKDLAKE